MPRGPKPETASSSVEHIPRPTNPFIIFRSDRLRNSFPNPTPGSHGRPRQKDVSREAAMAWKDINPTLKLLYEIQADIIKGEHSKKYPGWAYRPKFMKERKRMNTVMDDDRPQKRRATTSRQMSSKDSKAKQRVVAAHSAAPPEIVWDSSWFSESSSMTDPFYSTPIQPLTSSILIVSSLASTHPHLVSNVHAISSEYNPGPRASEEVSTLEPDPPIRGLAKNLPLAYDKVFADKHYHSFWEDPAFDLGSVPLLDDGVLDVVSPML